MPDESLTEEQIILLGKHVGNAVNGLKGPELYDPDKNRAIDDGAKLLVQEMLDPFDERVVPEED